MPEWTTELRARLEPLGLAAVQEAEIVEELAAHLDDRYRELSVAVAPDEARRLALADLDGDGLLAARLAALRRTRGPEPMPPPGAPRRSLLGDFWQDLLGFTLVLSLATGLVFGLAPALSASRPDVSQSLKLGTVDRRTGPSRLKKALVVGQVAASLALLVAAGLFVRSLQRAQATDPGFEADRLLTAALQVNLLRYTTPQGREFYTRLTDRLEALPGVASVSLARMGLLPGGGRIVDLFVEGGSRESQPANTESPAVVAANVVAPRYFKTLGIALRRGRDFEPADGAASPPVAIVNETLSRQLLTDADAIGRRVSLVGPGGPWTEIVGVVADSTYGTVGERPPPVVYVPLAQNHETGMTLMVRSAVQDPAALVPAVRAAIRDLEPNLPTAAIQLGRDRIATALYSARMGAWLLGGFAVLALVLSAIGVYGVLSYSTAQRTREMGLRVALGAGPRRILGLVVREGMGLVAAGIAIGVAGALLAARSLESFLYGVSGRDLVTFAVVSVGLAAVALIACVAPARRAMRVDPTIALRSE
jgi:predicted permease